MTVSPVSFWLDGAPAPRAVLTGTRRADVAIIGAGFTGLWTALALTERDPSLEVVVLEAATVGHGASGRNGGFVEPSLTHGVHNGLAHFPDEHDELVRLGAANYRGFVDDVHRFGIDASLDEAGVLDVATEPWQVADLEEAAPAYAAAGERVELLDADEARAEVDSPTYLGALHRPEGGATVDPGALVRGLAAEAERRGVRIHERSPVRELAEHGTGLLAVTPAGRLDADRVVLATNAYSHRVLPRTARHFVPVYDHVLLTEPLTGDQLASIGWKRRQGVADGGNQFHYYRLTADDRLLWGGYDAIYRFGNRVGSRYDHRPATYALLERHLRATFPQLRDVAIDRRWGGAIATTTRFTVAFGEAFGGRLVYALGYTGLGVAATRFAGQVLRDRLLDPTSPLLELELVRRPPFPFPPEPLRWAGVTLTRRALARSDRREGRRGPWLAVLDRFGVGFDS
ncbi:FAD-dependent oxidoreductase [Nitriliruptoraceae bacterium ZYF776]|nr:FAD-dependent oxidoreductase [Profundirhabdus halotolerans]